MKRLALGALLLGVCCMLEGSALAAEDETRMAAAEPARVVDAGPPRADARARLETIRARIQSALRYPPLARERALEGTTWMRFEIDRAGEPQRVEVHRSSGRPSLDRAASAAVSAAAPLPWVYGRLEVPVLFELERRR